MDIGSNTVRLLIAKTGLTGWQRKTLAHKVTRLSGGFDGSLQPPSISRTVAVIKEFTEIARSYDIHDIRAACTGVTRKAVNTGEFLDITEKESGLRPIVISGEAEAGYTAKGAFELLEPGHSAAIIFDIGGFSTEIILAEIEKPTAVVSLDLGVVRLTEDYLPDPIPNKGQLEKVVEIINKSLNESYVIQDWKNAAPSVLIATAGTPTSLAAMDLGLDEYESEKVEGYVLSKNNIRRMYVNLCSLTPDQRLKKYPSLEKGREDVLPAGILICEAMMEMFGFNNIHVTEGGLLEGLIIAEKFP